MGVLGVLGVMGVMEVMGVMGVLRALGVNVRLSEGIMAVSKNIRERENAALKGLRMRTHGTVADI